MNNSTCPSCGAKMKRNGRTKAGAQRWRCKSCGASSVHGNNTDAADLMHVETLRQADLWAERFLEWCGFWCDFLDERTVVDGRRVYTHERLVKARRGLVSLANASNPREAGGPIEWGDRAVWSEMHRSTPYPYSID